MSRLAVRGGPFDGQDVAAAGIFRWVSLRGGHSAPAPGRALYKVTPKGYEYVGDRSRWCPRCCAAVSGRGTCPMCGTKTKPAYWPQPEEE